MLSEKLTRSITDDSFIRSDNFLIQTRKAKDVLERMNSNMKKDIEAAYKPVVPEKPRVVFKNIYNGKMSKTKTRNSSKVSFKFDDNN